MLKLFKLITKRRFKKHFRFNFAKARNHPTYVYDESDKEYHYIGITHSKKTRGMRNIELKKNPNKRDTKKSYIRPIAEKDKKKNFSKKPIKNMKLSHSDKKKVRKVIKKSIKKHKKSI